MKLITAVIQPDKLTDVKDALFAAGIKKMTVFSVQGCGQQAGYEETYRGTIVHVTLLKKTQIEIAVNSDHVEPTINAIVKGARTGSIGDGKIFVRELEECVRIRTGERGKEAIG